MHKFIDDDAVIGIPNDDSGELQQAYVIMQNKGDGTEELTKAEIMSGSSSGWHLISNWMEELCLVTKYPSQPVTRFCEGF